MTVKYAPELERDCVICLGRYFDLPAAIRAHLAVHGHMPRSLHREEVTHMDRCPSCGGPINPQTHECRCSD